MGDGLGYDIISFDENGEELYLEVKTTNADRTTPFFISQNELDVSARLGLRYRLFRVFDFASAAKAFVISGPLGNKLALKAQVYVATARIP